ncbi:DUF5320 domain-containing protein [Chloroflexota bacterium]
MPGFDRTGPAGMGPMTGGRRGFCSPWGVRGAVHTYSHANWNPYHFSSYGSGTFYPQMTRDQEFEFLKSQAIAMKRQLNDIETRVKELDKK